MSRRILARSSFALLLLALVAPSDAEIYRWTDASGREHFSSNPLDVPESQRTPASTLGDEGTVSSFDSVPPLPRRSRVRRTPAARQTGSAAIAEGGVIGGRDEVSWRMTAQSHRDDISSAESRLERCEARDERERDRSGLTALDACAAEQRAIESAEEKLTSFEDLARSKGVPPGWLR